MSLLEALLVGLAEARRHLGQTLLSLLGLILGTGSIVTVLALFGGQSKVTQDYIAEVGGFGTVIVRDRDQSQQPTARELASRRLTYRDAKYLKERATTLSAVAPGYYGDFDFRAGGTHFRGPVVGTTPDYAIINDITPLVGRYLSELDVQRKSRVTVLGWSYADSLFGTPEAALGQLVSLDGRSFTVVGVLEREYFSFAVWSGNELEYRNQRAYIPVTTAFNQFTGNDDRLSFLTLKATAPTGARGAQAQVTALLRFRHGVEDFDITPSGAGGNQDADFFKLFNFIFLVVGVVSLIAGGVVIANILLASVVERVREFGTRMALGATGLQIFAQVLAQVIVIAVIGGTLGLTLGWALTGTVAYFMKMPAAVTPLLAGVAIGTSLAVGFVAGLYPAFRAARLSPVEALRYA
ncbi:MAG: ABC transporter permease [Gemmatimonadota bacterium]|nr:ABC transporter permease [Gemmatimonadota bacterium]MDH4350708.1 ABC transporter permease [Gemmatimonadota bacterium]